MEHTGAAYIFINFEQAVQLGHIGWGFHLDEDRYFFGSTDHLWNLAYPMWHPAELYRYMDVQPTKNNDYWSSIGSEQEMLQVMHSGPHVRYHAYKRIPVTEPQTDAAVKFAEGMKDRGWNVVQNNCVHQSYAILTKYGGAILPDAHTALNRIPRHWFKQIPGESVTIETRLGNVESVAQLRTG
ncbi:MAG TPA: hypothetical protein V6C76_09935 [Drouetiella sp.]